MVKSGLIEADGILFDKDGTLIDFDAFWVSLSSAALEVILSSLQQDTALVQPLLALFGVRDGVTDINSVLCKGTYGQLAQILQAFLQERGCAVSLVTLEKLVLDSYNGCAHLGEVRPTCPELPAVLQSLKAKGKKLGLVTTDNPKLSALCLEKLGVLELFDHLYTDDGSLPVKPDPGCALAFCDAEGLTAHRVVMVGDTLTDMEFARNAGLKAIGLASRVENRASLAPHADQMIGTLSELLEILE